MNKIDQLPSPSHSNAVFNRYPAAVPVSAKRGLGFDTLAYRVSDALSRSFRDIDVETGVDNGRLMAYLAAHGEVLSKRFGEQRAVIHCRIPQKFLGRIAEGGGVVRARDEAAETQPDHLDQDHASAREDVA